MKTIASPEITFTPPQAVSQLPNPLLLDVRTPAEFRDRHIDGSHLLPLHQLDPDTVRTLAQSKSACLLICGTGKRAQTAAEKLASAGLGPLHILEGGITAWEQQGLPLIVGPKTISLERQVRIAAGSLVLLGVILGYLLNPAWTALSAFVGAGLIFAGLTDTCGMGLLLARMPWNQTRA
ncbi:MAG: rhodanese-like domain-containing protein [Verrucomicrobiia bacterium]